MDEERIAKGGARTSKTGAKPDFATIAGILIALVGIVGGLLIEGGKLRDIAQLTAALIVLGGTLGAVMVSTPMPVLLGAIRRFKGVLLNDTAPNRALVEELIGYATKARKHGLVSLEQQALEIKEPFLAKGLNLAVDGTDIQEIRKMLELEIDLREANAGAEAKVFENAGGYAPTVGIIGAVLGLIQVMKNLANIDEVGHGIAGAFVATIYGVGIANLILLPAAAKIKIRARMETHRRELILEGVCGIVEGLNPKLIRQKLEAFTLGTPSPKKTMETESALQAESPVDAGA